MDPILKVVFDLDAVDDAHVQWIRLREELSRKRDERIVSAWLEARGA